LQSLRLEKGTGGKGKERGWDILGGRLLPGAEGDG